MKLNFGKKLVLFLHWLLSLIGCALALMFCVWPKSVYNGFEWAYDLIGKRNTDIIGIVVGCIYVIFMLGSAFILFSGNGRRGERGFITVDSSDSGRTRIAVGAVEQMIRQAIRGVDGITELKTSITNNEDAISIGVNVAILNGVHVPTVTMNIQRSVRSYIELNCGVAVRDVSVNVHSVTGLDEGGKRGHKKSAAAAAPISVAPVSLPEEKPASETPAYEAPKEEEIPTLTPEPEAESTEDVQTAAEEINREEE